MNISNKKSLTILIGAGAVIDASRDYGHEVSTNTITEEILTGITDKEVNELVNMINGDLIPANKRYDKTPNFEDIFHFLEVLNSAYTIKSSAPEYIPMYKYFMDIKEKYNKFNPYINETSRLNPLGHVVTNAQSEIIKIIQKNIESYSDKKVVSWYKNFFNKLNEKFNLNIFSLNYDTWFEQIFEKYNDGFYNADDTSDFYKFSPFNIINSKKSINIHYLHGQIDFRTININENSEKRYGDYKLDTIYKIKDSKKTKRLLDPCCGNKTTQAGEQLKNCPIITGKIKIEKTIYPPFDAYRTNLYNCIVTNPNLLIIGYGFADYYIDSLLSQFHNIHNNKKRVTIIDFESEKNWKLKSYHFDIVGHKLHTMFGLCNDKQIEPSNLKRYSKIIRLDKNRCNLYSTGFKNVANNNIDQIIEFYSKKRR